MVTDLSILEEIRQVPFGPGEPFLSQSKIIIELEHSRAGKRAIPTQVIQSYVDRISRFVPSPTLCMGVIFHPLRNLETLTDFKFIADLKISKNDMHSPFLRVESQFAADLLSLSEPSKEQE